MATLEQLEKQKKQIENRIKAKKQSLRKEERKAENHAKMVIGGMVLSHFKTSWKGVDFEKLAAYFNQYSNAVSRNTCEELDYPQAKERLRNWERGNAWNSYGKEPEAAEDGNQGFEGIFGYPQTQNGNSWGYSNGE